MNQKHLTEKQINFLVISPESLTGTEQMDLKTHISACELCREHFEAVQAFYTDIEQKMQEPPSTKDEELAEKLVEREPGCGCLCGRLRRKARSLPLIRMLRSFRR